MRRNLDCKKLVGKSWGILMKELVDDNFWVDHYHGILETENELGEKFQDLVHIDAFTARMTSTLMGMGSEQPEDFISLNADESHE